MCYVKHALTLKMHITEYTQLNAASAQPGRVTYCSQVIHVGALGSHNAAEAFLLRGTVRLIQVGLPIAVHHAPLAVQHAKAIPEN